MQHLGFMLQLIFQQAEEAKPPMSLGRWRLQFLCYIDSPLSHMGGKTKVSRVRLKGVSPFLFLQPDQPIPHDVPIRAFLHGIGWVSGQSAQFVEDASDQ